MIIINLELGPENFSSGFVLNVSIFSAAGSCNFELDLCSWSNLHGGDNFDWVRASGTTTSTGTGPPGDHTYSNSTGEQ